MVLHYIRYCRIFGLLVLCISLASCHGLQEKRNLASQLAVQQKGVKYVYGGYTPQKGFDCSGLVYYVFHTRMSLSIPRTVAGLDKSASRVWLFKKPGDLLFFNTNYKWYKPWSWGKVNHVGIYLGHNRMIHAPTSGKKVYIVENVFKNRYWKKRYKYTKRIIK